jgi:hypothetical protein
VLTPSEIKEVASDLQREAISRDYVKYILAPAFTEEHHAWELIVEVMEVVLHRRDLYITPRARVKGLD